VLWLGMLLVAVIGAGAFATRGMGFTARAVPSSLETRLALAARRWATPASARAEVFLRGK
jgi:hypothetical protein